MNLSKHLPDASKKYNKKERNKIMKKGLLKSLLCFALAGTLLFGDAGITLAAVANDVKPAEQTQQVKNAATASVDYLYAYLYSSGSIEFSYYGYGAKFDVYVNGVKIENKSQENNRLIDSVWDETTQTYVDIYEEAPYTTAWDWYLDVDAQPGVSYEVTVVPYTYSGAKGTSETYTVKTDFPIVEDVRTYVSESLVYNKDNKTTGYTQFEGIYGYIEPSNWSWDYTYEVWRSTKKSSGYQLLTTVSGSGDVYWSDSTAKLGTTYYYKVRPIAKQDAYVSTQINGGWSEPYEVKAGEPLVTGYAYYANEGVYVYTGGNEQMTTGIEVYRSTKKSKGYKKIATTAEMSYLDTTAKKNTTYYYKLKPFFYNQKTGKKVYGSYTEPIEVKTNMAVNVGLVATQTSKTKAKLEWEKVTGATSYEIYMRKGVPGEAYKYVGSTKKSKYTVKNLKVDTTYYFQVRAVKKANNIKSEYLLMSDSIYTGLNSPSNLRVTKKAVSIKNNTLTIKSTLKWDVVYGASKYRVEAYDSETGAYKVLKNIKKNTTTSYVLTNTKKKDGTWKYSSIKVVAIKGEDESSAYNYDIDALASVKGVKVKKASATSAKVSWKKVDGATTYTVTRYSPNGQSCLIGSTDKLNLVDTCLTPGVTYTYTVTANNSDYEVSSAYEYSEEGTALNNAAYVHKVTAPKISSATAKAKVTWKKVDGATKYIVYRSTSKKGKFEKVGTSKTTSFTDKKAKNGKTYYYKVVAVVTNDAGIAVESSMSSAFKSKKIKK